MKKAPKSKTNRKDWGSNNTDALMEEKLKKINDEKKSKEVKDHKKGIKENFTNLPQEKFNQIKECGKNKIANKLGQTQNLEHLLSKKDKKLKDEPSKPPKPKRDVETMLIKKAELKEQFKQ